MIGNRNPVAAPRKQVEYLVEACDPCESGDCAYLIEDVVVSDFFTPHYHDPVVSPGTRYPAERSLLIEPWQSLQSA